MNELLHELRFGTEAGARKEACDLLYVIFGTAANYGWPIDEDFALVHENNMLKIKTEFIGPNGKLMKSKDHPKVELPPLKHKQPRTICGIQQELPIEYPITDLPRGSNP